MPVSQLAASPCHFNPLPPHGGRQCNLVLFVFVLYFNPLPPHGGRQSSIVLRRTLDVFQSTPSTRRETGDACKLWIFETEFQSTPSTRRETRSIIYFRPRINYFNPLPPHGGRRNSSAAPISEAPISIHSLHTEGDMSYEERIEVLKNFNPLPPHGGRRMRSHAKKTITNFNPLPPHGGRLEYFR